jgi:hypothetical protein
MQEEISKHTKKIFKSVKNEHASRGEKIKEIILEIFIIVFAVSLSIWLHDWSEHRHQQKEAREFIRDLKDDLGSDIKNLQAAHDSLAKALTTAKFLYGITLKNADSILAVKGAVNFRSNIGTTKISSANYEGFKSSGKIGYLENRELKKNILKYYTDATPNLTEAETINAAELIDISKFFAENADRSIKQNITSPTFKSLLATFAGTSNDSLKLYEEAIKIANQILAEVETE